MNRQNSSAKMSVEDIDAVLRALKELRHKMPFLIALTPRERRRRPHVGLRHLGTVENSLMAAREHPDILPASIDVEQFAEDVHMMIRLHNCLIGLRGLTGDVQDTLMALGTQTLKVSQHVRTLVFAAAKTTPGLRLTAQRLAAPSTRGLSTETTASAPSAQPSPTPERPNSPLTERTPERPAEEAA